MMQGEKKNTKKKFKKNNRNSVKSEFEKRVIAVRRVSRVVAGGRRFSFSATVVLGNKKGKVGIGIGNGADTSTAINKASNNAQKNLTPVRITEDASIAYEVDGKYCASRVTLRPANGLVAGGAVRTVAELAGIKNVNTKILSRSKNAVNNAKATLVALNKLLL